MKWSVNKKLDSKLGFWLKSQRLSMNMTQEELGKISGITTQQIGKYESGKNRIPAIFLIAFCNKFKLPCPKKNDLNKYI